MYLKPPAMRTCGKCICGSNKAKVDEVLGSQLIQFLMGLSEAYDNIGSQILVLDPLLDVNKAYSMVSRVERQRQVNMEFAEVADQTTFQVKGYGGNISYINKKVPVDKRNLMCEYCHKLVHNKDSCFKIHGVPDWYKELTDQRKKPSPTNRAYAAITPESVRKVAQITGNRGSDLIFNLIKALRLVQNKTP
ncbi:UNVERIFIED_CONTAM: hypothetical protein Sradi_4085600 [Sesamum radiatum]|uniref:Uncharacterized protein n=1 Tax=Sesamum radiatum TaxID=300843 RepID=A0AAW2PJE1_SESRA